MIFLLHDVYLLAKLIIIFLEIFFVNDFPQFDAAARKIILKKNVEAYNQCNDNALPRLYGYGSTTSSI